MAPLKGSLQMVSKNKETSVNVENCKVQTTIPCCHRGFEESVHTTSINKVRQDTLTPSE